MDLNGRRFNIFRFPRSKYLTIQSMIPSVEQIKDICVILAQSLSLTTTSLRLQEYLGKF